MIGITTGRRLHFGLFTPVPVPELDLVYGGVGVMVDVPGISITAEPCEVWRAEGPQSPRLLDYLRPLQPQVAPGSIVVPQRFQVTYAAPAHQGWGTGTQLALAAARLLYSLSKHPWSAQAAARRLGRGSRSGIGIAGFDHPGLLFDQGKRIGEESGSISAVKSVRLPQAWTWLLVEPRGEVGLHSDEERGAFSRIPAPDLSKVNRLRELSEGLHAAVIRHDFKEFAISLTAYNRLAGSLYESVQGGVYGSPLTAARIAHLESRGAKGVGQSSWGPGIFAVFPDEASAQAVRSRLELPNCTVHLGRTACTSPRVDSSPAAR